MIFTTPLHTSLQWIRKIVLAGILLFSCSLLHAQVDSAFEAPPAPLQEDEKVNVISTDDQENEFFLRLSDYDSLRVHTRTVPDSLLKQFRDDKSFWYTRTDAQKGDRKLQPRREVKEGKQVERQPGSEEANQSEPYKPLGSQTWFQSLMWIIIIGGFAGAIAWYLANNNVGLFRKKEKKLTENKDDGEIPEDIFAINYQQEIDKAAAQGNYRLAIRLMYLRILRNLSDRNIIQYKQDRTNLDYLMQLQPTAYYRDFFRVTRHYEYSWYGEFNVSADAYSIIRHEFDQFEKTTG